MTGDDLRLKSVVAVLLVVVTIIAGAFGLVSTELAVDQSDVFRLAEDATVEMLEERDRAAQRVGLEQQAENVAAEQRAFARALRERAGTDPALRAEQRAAERASREAAESSALGADASVLRQTTSATERFKARQEVGFIRAREYQEAYADQSQDLRGQTASLLAAIAVLAVGLFLLGSSLVVAQPRARRVFVATGVAIALAATAWGVATALAPSRPPVDGAIEALVRASELRRGGFAELSEGSDRATEEGRALMRRAIDELDTAIRLRPDYARAYQGRAIAHDLLAFSDPRGSRGSAQARDDYLRARALGAEPSLVLNNLALTEFRLGDEAAAIAAAEAAIRARPNVANSHETLTSLLRYSDARATPRYRRELAILRGLWAERPAEVRTREINRAVAGITETAEKFPRLAARARAYRRDLDRIAASFARG